MALLNKTEESNPSSGTKESRKISHFFNVNVVKNDGTTIKLGAINVYEGGDKIQRSLLAAIEAGQIKAEEVALKLDIRENIKSTEVMAVDDWAKVSIVETEATE